MKHRLALMRGVALVTFAGYVESGVGLLAGVLIARTLGPQEYGHYAWLIWLCGLLASLCNHALTSSSIRYLAELRGAGRAPEAAALVGRLMRLQTASSLVVLGGFALWMAWRPPAEWRDALALTLALVVVAVWARAGFWLRGALGKGFERFEPENIPLALVALLNLAGTAVLAWRGAGTLQFLALYAVLGIAAQLLARGLLRRYGVQAAHAPLPAELLARLHRHLLLTGVMILLSLATARSLEMTLLKRFADAASVGYFAIAGSLSKGAIDLLVGGLAAVLLPSMARRYGSEGHGGLARVLAESTRLYWVLGLAIAGLGSIMAGGAIRLLYGARYEGAIAALVWQLVVAGLSVSNGAAAAALSASERQMDRIVGLLLAFVVNLVLAWLLIPRYGLTGAMVSAAATQVCATALNWHFAIRRTGVRLPLALLARLTLAGALAALLGHLVARLAHPLAFLLGGALFVVAFLPLSVVLRTWRRVDYQLLANMFRRTGATGHGLADRLERLEVRYGVQ